MARLVVARATATMDITPLQLRPELRLRRYTTSLTVAATMIVAITAATRWPLTRSAVSFTADRLSARGFPSAGQILLPYVVRDMRAPARSTATPTGRPRALPLSINRQPLPEGRLDVRSRNGTKITLYPLGRERFHDRAADKRTAAKQRGKRAVLIERKAQRCGVCAECIIRHVALATKSGRCASRASSTCEP